MADNDQKDQPKVEETNISPAPTAIAGKTEAVKSSSEKENQDHANGPQPDPLSDGTVPTVLSAGDAHRSVSKGKASLTTIYRRADIMTTLLTLGGALVAAAIILGIYAFVTLGQNKNKAKTPVLSNKVTNLSASDLQKLNAFFGGNSAGSSAEVLTVNSSSLFDGRVAVNSDLEVTGGETIKGTATDSNLTVNSTATLGVTSVRGQLTVSGPTTLQGAAVLTNGLTVTGNVTASGNGSFGGSLAAGTINALTLNVGSAFNLSSHLNTNGASPQASGATIAGDDSAGSISAAASSVTVSFHTGYTKQPIVMLTPTSACTGGYYVTSTGGSGFIITNPNNCRSFNYWVVQ